eukprot:5905387-Pyramimonas_sp.AAC.1
MAIHPFPIHSRPLRVAMSRPQPSLPQDPQLPSLSGRRQPSARHLDPPEGAQSTAAVKGSN